jgi:hypothetical protein
MAKTAFDHAGDKEEFTPSQFIQFQTVWRKGYDIELFALDSNGCIWRRKTVDLEYTWELASR